MILFFAVTVVVVVVLFLPLRSDNFDISPLLTISSGLRQTEPLQEGGLQDNLGQVEQRWNGILQQDRSIQVKIVTTRRKIIHVHT